MDNLDNTFHAVLDNFDEFLQFIKGISYEHLKELKKVVDDELEEREAQGEYVHECLMKEDYYENKKR